MRKVLYVPMMILCLLLGGCGAGAEEEASQLRDFYHDMEGCTMEAELFCTQNDREWTAQLRCDYMPEGESTVEVLAPDTIAGVKAVLEDGSYALEYEDLALNAGYVSGQQISPMTLLPRLMGALRDGWLLEENEELWEETPCLRLTVDQSGLQDGKIVSTLWLRQEDGTPVRGEVAVDGEIILTAEFTSFAFYDTIEKQGA